MCVDSESTCTNQVQIGCNCYKNTAIEIVEPWDVIDSWPLEQRIGYYRGSALTYLMRMELYDEPAKEIARAIHYLRKLVTVLEETSAD